jgi:hypothetical protein
MSRTEEALAGILRGHSAKELTELARRLAAVESAQ